MMMITKKSIIRAGSTDRIDRSSTTNPSLKACNYPSSRPLSLSTPNNDTLDARVQYVQILSYHLQSLTPLLSPCTYTIHTLKGEFAPQRFRITFLCITYICRPWLLSELKITSVASYLHREGFL